MLLGAFAAEIHFDEKWRSVLVGLKLADFFKTIGWALYGR
jgi:hypothetical protein